jgi:hypothetical protein
MTNSPKREERRRRRIRTTDPPNKAEEYSTLETVLSCDILIPQYP